MWARLSICLRLSLSSYQALSAPASVRTTWLSQPRRPPSVFSSSTPSAGTVAPVMPTMRRLFMAVSVPANLVLVVFCPFAAGYFLSFFFRHVNAVIAKDLAAELSLTSADLGFLTSMYLLAFAAFQLPLGVLLDRY